MDGVNEINAMIDPFSLSTYLCDLSWINDRQLVDNKLFIEYGEKWYTWREFLIKVTQQWFAVRMGRILHRHLETEEIKNAFLSMNN